MTSSFHCYVPEDNVAILHHWSAKEIQFYCVCIWRKVSFRGYRSETFDGNRLIRAFLFYNARIWSGIKQNPYIVKQKGSYYPISVECFTSIPPENISSGGKYTSTIILKAVQVSKDTA